MATSSVTKSDPLDSPSAATTPVQSAEAAARGALESILRIREGVRRETERLLESWRAAIALPAYRPSAENLARYLALRRLDLSDLQPTLSALGLSSLGRCEGHVMANLDAVAAALSRICGRRCRRNESPAAGRAAPRVVRPGQRRGGDHGHFAQRSGERRRVGGEFRRRRIGLRPDQLRARRRAGLGRHGQARQAGGEEIRPRLQNSDGSARTEMSRRNALAQEARAGSRGGLFSLGGRPGRSGPRRHAGHHHRLSRRGCASAVAGAGLDRRRQDPWPRRRPGRNGSDRRSGPPTSSVSTRRSRRSGPVGRRCRSSSRSRRPRRCATCPV